MLVLQTTIIRENKNNHFHTALHPQGNNVLLVSNKAAVMW